MKKKIIALLVCIALLATTVLFAACGPTTLVDTSGKYEASTKEEVTKLLEGKTVESVGAYEVKLTMTVQMDNTSGNVDYTAIMATDSDGKVTMSGNVDMSAKYPDGTNMQVNSAFYSDGDYLYITVADQKVKMSAMQGDTMVPTYVIPNGDLIKLLRDMPEDATIEVATSGDITKVKLAYSVEGEGASTMYIILNKGELTGLKLTGSAEEAGMTMTLEMASTKKTVNVPTDLDQYKEQM